MIRLVITLVALSFAHNAYALIDAHVTAGQKTAKVNAEDDDVAADDELQGTTVAVGVHYHPFKLVPIGIGAFGEVAKTTAEISNSIDAEISQQTIGIEMTAWVPMPVIKPFVKANYVLYGRAEEKFTIEPAIFDVAQFKTEDAKISGHSIAAGVMWSVVPTLGIVAQYAMNREQLAHKKHTITAADGTETTTEADETKTNFTGRSISLGLSFTL